MKEKLTNRKPPEQEDKQEQQQVISEQPDKLEGGETTGRVDASGKRLCVLALTALGIVYGDIGTCPLYAFRFAFYREGQISPIADKVPGVLPLIFWSLTIVISIKYISYVTQSDNEGEGVIQRVWHGDPRSSSSSAGLEPHASRHEKRDQSRTVPGATKSN